MKFRSDDPSIADAFEKKRHLPVLRSGHPASDVCLSCWAQQTCLTIIFSGSKPKTCCVYDFFTREDQSTVDKMVNYTCGLACVVRQSWEYDHVPHDANYCKDHCPVSRYLTDRGPSNYEP